MHPFLFSLLSLGNKCFNVKGGGGAKPPTFHLHPGALDCDKPRARSPAPGPQQELVPGVAILVPRCVPSPRLRMPPGYITDQEY